MVHLERRNNMAFSNINIDAINTLQVVVTEFTIWNEAQVEHIRRVNHSREDNQESLPWISGIWCFTNGSWKEKNTFLRQGWYNTLEGFNGLMGAKNTRASLFPLHSEIEALIWAMESMRNLRQFHVTFARECSQLVKLISESKEWPTFATYLEDIQTLKESFNYNGCITKRLIVWHPVPGNKRHLSFTWMQSYHLSLQSFSWVCLYCWQQKIFNIF